ncbi:MAG: PAS domain-containing sensor histidine kinase [Acidobacteriota bacterium]
MDLLESVLSSLNGEMIVLDNSGNIIALNRAWTEANSGIPEKVFVGDNYLKVCRKRNGKFACEAKKTADGIETVLKGNAADFELEYVCDFSSGLEQCLMTVTKLEGDSGGALVVHQNITRRKQFDSKKLKNGIRNSEERFSKLFNFIPLSMTISSLEDHRYVAVNERFTQLSGIAREDAIGITGQETGFIMSEESAQQFIERLRENGSVNNFETDIIRPDGELLTVLLFAAKMEIGGEAFMAVASNDITERKKAERDLRDLTTRLLNLQDKERRRLARELHDTTAQKISAVLLTLSYLKKIIKEPDEKVTSAIDEAISMAERSLGEIRTLSYVFHPPLLDQAGLNSALRWFVGGFIKRSGIAVELICTGNEARLPIEMESAMFRIVQESLNNIHRHSGSKNAFIRFNQNESEAVLEIRDEGDGIIKDSEHDEDVLLGDIETLGVGIVGMRERLRQFGGELFIKSGPHGTVITARIPLK